MIARKALVFLSLSILAACGLSNRDAGDSPEDILGRMRSDTAWIRELDSLAAEAIGPGARCTDPVRHTFEYGGRTWLFNQDWGGVLEIPSGYIAEDDPRQAELSFHGTRAFSPDSAVVISFYAGFQGIGNGELVRGTRQGLEEEGVAIERLEMDDKGFIITALSAGGIRLFARHLFADGDGVEHAAGVQYPEDREGEAEGVIRMIGRYPLGPAGRPFKGTAVR